jgi:hypothetical protein
MSMNQGATQHLRAAEADGHRGEGRVAATKEIALEQRLRQLIDKAAGARWRRVELGARRFLPRSRSRQHRGWSDTHVKRPDNVTHRRILSDSSVYIPNAYSSKTSWSPIAEYAQLHDRCSSRCSLP